MPDRLTQIKLREPGRMLHPTLDHGWVLEDGKETALRYHARPRYVRVTRAANTLIQKGLLTPQGKLTA